LFPPCKTDLRLRRNNDRNLNEGFFLNDKLADLIAEGNAFGFIHAEFIASGYPLEALLQQAGGDETDRFINAYPPPATRAFMDRPNEFVILLLNRRVLVTQLSEDLRKGRQADAQF
jgi:hypothetical protein